MRVTHAMNEQLSPFCKPSYCPTVSLYIDEKDGAAGCTDGLTMTGTRVATTGAGVEVPISSLESTTLKAGSSVFTVCVSEMATAAKERLAATWPMACMLAGQKIWRNSSFVRACATAEFWSWGGGGVGRGKENVQLSAATVRCWPTSLAHKHAVFPAGLLTIQPPQYA